MEKAATDRVAGTLLLWNKALLKASPSLTSEELRDTRATGIFVGYSWEIPVIFRTGERMIESLRMPDCCADASERVLLAAFIFLFFHTFTLTIANVPYEEQDEGSVRYLSLSEKEKCVWLGRLSG